MTAIIKSDEQLHDMCVEMAALKHSELLFASKTETKRIWEDFLNYLWRSDLCGNPKLIESVWETCDLSESCEEFDRVLGDDGYYMHPTKFNATIVHLEIFGRVQFLASELLENWKETDSKNIKSLLPNLINSAPKGNPNAAN